MSIQEHPTSFKAEQINKSHFSPPPRHTSQEISQIESFMQRARAASELTHVKNMKQDNSNMYLMNSYAMAPSQISEEDTDS